MNEGKKGFKAKKQRVARIEPSKPRNFVAKNAVSGGAGAHKDKKKSAKFGDTKHKKDLYTESLQEQFEFKLNETGLDLLRRMKVIQFLSSKYGWDKNHLELASDEELIKWYEQSKAGQHPVDETTNKHKDSCACELCRGQHDVRLKTQSKKKEKGVKEGWGAEPMQRQIDASNARWHEKLAQYANDPEMTEYLKMFRVSNWGPDKSEAEAKKWIAQGKPLPQWYTDLKSGKNKPLGYKVSNETNEDQGMNDIMDWKRAVLQAYPEYVNQIKFKGRGTQINAEIPGVDRSFGVFDLDTGTGDVFSESWTYNDKLNSMLAEMIEKNIK